MATIVFTGGGSSGHVNPNIPIMQSFLQDGWRVVYIGSKRGPEVDICSKLEGCVYVGIESARLRRYFSWSNILIPLRVILGVGQAILALFREKPEVVFSKGGFVSVPVVLAAASLGIPVISHESDLTPGLATRINYRFSRRIFLTLPKSLYPGNWTASDKFLTTGIPVRDEFKIAQASRAYQQIKTELSRPMLLVFGGSSGSMTINKVIYQITPDLLKSFVIVHIVGKGNIRLDLSQTPDYHQFEYLHTGLEDFIVAASAIICRAGMTTIIELISLRKPAVLIPLSLRASRGDQIDNARLMSRLGCFIELDETSLSAEALYDAVHDCIRKNDVMVKCMDKLSLNLNHDIIKDKILKELQ